MERKILQQIPSGKEIAGIIACKDTAWGKLYPYGAFGEIASWLEGGELGESLRKGDLFAAVVKDEEGNVVAHAAAVMNKFGIEVGRVFALHGGQGLGTLAVDHLRSHIENLGHQEIHMGVSYNRTAMWRAFEKTFGANNWRLAILGLLPDIYFEEDNEKHMQWGEIISRAVKEGNMIFPALSSEMPESLQNFAQGIQRINEHCIQFSEELEENEALLPYQFSEHVFALSWHDYQNQRNFLEKGYKPVGVIKIYDQWHFIVFQGELPERKEERSDNLRFGRNPVMHPASVAGVRADAIMQYIYQD